MKKIVLIILLLPAIGLTQNSKFKLTPFGLFDSADRSKNYLVITIPNKSAKQLYDASVNFINETYKNPDIVIKGKIDSEYIRHEGYVKSITTVWVKNSFTKNEYNVSSSFVIELRFKSGKFRYEIFSNNMKVDYLGTPISPLHIVQQGSNWLGWDKVYVYDKNLQLKHEQLKKDIEDYFNNQVTSLINYIQGAGKKDF